MWIMYILQYVYYSPNDSPDYIIVDVTKTMVKGYPDHVTIKCESGIVYDNSWTNNNILVFGQLNPRFCVLEFRVYIIYW